MLPFPPDRVVLMDGAMGTELQRLGLAAGQCHELWNLTHPDRVLSVHRAYVEAGARILLTNTFQANPQALERHGILDRAAEIVRAGVELARAAGAECVLGDVGPWVRGVEPRRAGAAPFAGWFAGVDALLLETWSDMSVFDKITEIQRANEVPVWLSMTFRHDEELGICTLDRHVPEQVARRANAAGVAALGVNCGLEQTIENVAEVVGRYRQETDLPLFARPNAGTPIQRDGRWVYPLDARTMAEQIARVVDAGASLIGGCCGTTPEHIAALAPTTNVNRRPGRRR